MNNKLDFRKIIWEISNELRGVLYYKNIEFSVVRLLFLKYAVDNYIGAKSVENMQLCAKAQKMFAMKDIENGIATIIPVLQYIDSAYGLKDVLSGNENIENYACELFGDDKNRQRKNVITNDFKSVMNTLGSLDLEENNGDNSLGKELVDSLIENIVLSSFKNSFSGEYTTRANVSKLAKHILNVKADDVFCDFASGVGMSTIEITKDTLPKIINADCNNTAVAISAMLYIMYGYKNFKIFNEDSITRKNAEIYGNKIFVDGPLALRLKKTAENEYTDVSLAIINRVANDYLSTGGEESTAIISLTSSPLFTAKKQAIDLRHKIIASGMVKAVIALPPMWRGTSIGTNLLVLSRAPQDKILFINASEVTVTAKERMDVTGEALLPEKAINDIVQTVLNPENILDFSALVSIDSVIKKDCNLIPASYIEVCREEDTTTLEEIDAQLAVLYQQILG